MNILISYAMDFVSYLMLQPEAKMIKGIYLFGSVARGDFTKESDIDLFIDTSLNFNANKQLENYLITDRINKWKIFGIKNKISIICDDLNQKKWEELKINIEDNAFVLFGKLKTSKSKTNLKPHYLIKWQTSEVKPNVRIKISRFMYGYNSKINKYKGFVKETNSKQIGQGVIIIQPDNLKRIRQFLKENEIPFNSMILYVNE